MCVPILIKAISSLVIAVIGLVFFIVKKYKSRKIEKVVEIAIIVLCFGFGIIELYHSANPEIENITANLDYYNRPPYKMGYECAFTDSNGEGYLLYIDPLTLKKYADNGELEEDKLYEVSYDINENTIVSIN